VIYINIKASIILFLIILSFFNNLIRTYDNLKCLNQEIEVKCFLSQVDNIEIEKPFLLHIKTLYKYFIFFMFFYNIEEPLSIIDVMNY
jgi:hypothetical protein